MYINVISSTHIASDAVFTADLRVKFNEWLTTNGVSEAQAVAMWNSRTSSTSESKEMSMCCDVFVVLCVLWLRCGCLVECWMLDVWVVFVVGVSPPLAFSPSLCFPSLLSCSRSLALSIKRLCVVLLSIVSCSLSWLSPVCMQRLWQLGCRVSVLMSVWQVGFDCFVSPSLLSLILPSLISLIFVFDALLFPVLSFSKLMGFPSSPLQMCSEVHPELLQATYSEEVLNFPSGVPSLPTVGDTTQILLRNCYKTLFRRIKSLEKKYKDKCCIIVTGNPGIGKSYFLCYLIWKYALEKRVVIFESAREYHIVCWNFSQKTCQLSTRDRFEKDFFSQLRDRKTVYLFDCAPTQVVNRTLVLRNMIVL